jgi:hypothetical protein
MAGFQVITEVRSGIQAGTVHQRLGFFCRRKAGKQPTISMESSLERRSHARKAKSISAVIAWREAGAQLKQVGKVVNASEGGLGLIVKLAVPVGSPVTISCGKETLIGMVEHQSATVAGYLIGVEIDSSSTPFPAKFMPDSDHVGTGRLR